MPTVRNKRKCVIKIAEKRNDFETRTRARTRRQILNRGVYKSRRIGLRNVFRHSTPGPSFFLHNFCARTVTNTFFFLRSRGRSTYGRVWKLREKKKNPRPKKRIVRVTERGGSVGVRRQRYYRRYSRRRRTDFCRSFVAVDNTIYQVLYEPRTVVSGRKPITTGENRERLNRARNVKYKVVCERMRGRDFRTVHGRYRYTREKRRTRVRTHKASLIRQSI